MKKLIQIVLALAAMLSLPSCITVIPGDGGSYGGGGPGYGSPPRPPMPPQMRMPQQQRPMYAPNYGGGYPQQRPVYGGGGYHQPRPSYGGPNYGGGYNSPPPQHGRRNPIYRDWNQSTVAPPGYRQGPITYDPNRRY